MDDRLKAARGRAVKRLIAAGGLILLSVLLFGLGKLMPGVIDAAYAPFSRRLIGLMAGALSFVPFSFAEFAVLLAAALCLTFLFVAIGRTIAGGRGAHDLLCYAGHLFLSLGVAAFLFTAVWGLNYTASPLEEKLELPVRDRSAAALEATAFWLLDMTNAAADNADRVGGIVVADGFFGLYEDAPGGFAALAEENSVFAGHVALPKRVTFWPLLGYTGISGIFFPFTGEANVNPDSPDSTLPFTMCHEIAHSLGFASEDDANFVAFLACERSGNGNYNYSGAFSAFIYVYNAAAEENPDLQRRLYEALAEDVRADMEVLGAHYRQYTGPLREMGEQINDTYLRVIGQQPEGVKSYGRVVDLLIAEYVKRYGEPGTV